MFKPHPQELEKANFSDNSLRIAIRYIKTTANATG